VSMIKLLGSSVAVSSARASAHAQTAACRAHFSIVRFARKLVQLEALCFLAPCMASTQMC
jgi:hypothetical protein